MTNPTSESFSASLCVFLWAIALALWAFFNRWEHFVSFVFVPLPGIVAAKALNG